MLRSISRFFHKMARGWVIIVLAAVFIPYILTTLPVVRSLPGGNVVSLDAQLFYTPQRAFAIVGSYGSAAPYWIRIYLTWDMINPIMYTLLLGVILSWLLQRSVPAESRLRSLNVLPLVSGIFDVVENVAIVVLLSAYPSRPEGVAWLASIFTLGKVVFLGASLLVAGVGLIAAAKHRFRPTPAE